MDIIAKLAELGFASRLRRLGERLSRDVSRLYHELDIDFEARWFAVFYALGLKSKMTVTELAEALGITHTAVIAIAGEIINKGYINSSKGIKDERQRILRLTSKGKKTTETLKPVWKAIRRETNELIETAGMDILKGMDIIERQLDKRNMCERTYLRLKGKLPGEVNICEYSPAFKKYFKSLNIEWLEEYFKVEKKDQQQLSDPRKQIIKKGGTIFFACINDKVVGTCALIRHKDGTLELAKMAVTRKFRGRGIGKLLLEAAIKPAKELGAEKLYLETSEKLKTASHLYRKYGFRKTNFPSEKSSVYKRLTFTMMLQLK